MNKILQKRIKEAAKFIAVKNAPLVGTRLYDGCCYDSCIEMAEFLLKNQWISVEEALPTERDEEDEQYSTNVFARTKDCIRYAYYDFYNESWCSVEGGYRFGGDVTHWMPIPSMKGGEK